MVYKFILKLYIKLVKIFFSYSIINLLPGLEIVVINSYTVLRQFLLIKSVLIIYVVN